MNEQQKKEFLKSILAKLNYYGLTVEDLAEAKNPPKDKKKPKKD